MTGETPPLPTPRVCLASRLRFTLRGLMVACFYLAFAMAAVLRPSMLAAHFLQATLACLLAAAAVWAIAGRGAWRAFHFGFATVGIAYLALTWLTLDGSPTLMATSRIVHRLMPGELALQDHPAFFASCAAVENAAYATLGGAIASLLALLVKRWRRRRTE